MTLLKLSEANVIPLTQLSSVSDVISMTIVVFCQDLEAHAGVLYRCSDEAGETLFHPSVRKTLCYDVHVSGLMLACVGM